MRGTRATWSTMLPEAAGLAFESVRTERVRSLLAIAGIVIGIVTVVLVASVLANARNQIALLFRDLGTDNVFAFHLTGDPYVIPGDREARRRPLEIEFVDEIKRLGRTVRDVGAQVIVPTASGAQVLVARAGGNESDTVLVEGASPALFDIIGAEFARGRPFTEVEDRQGARVAIVGASLARALFGNESPIGRTLTLGGEAYTVVGELQTRRGGFLGENRRPGHRRDRQAAGHRVFRGAAAVGCRRGPRRLGGGRDRGGLLASPTRGHARPGGRAAVRVRTPIGSATRPARAASSAARRCPPCATPPVRHHGTADFCVSAFSHIR